MATKSRRNSWATVVANEGSSASTSTVVVTSAMTSRTTANGSSRSPYTTPSMTWRIQRRAGSSATAKPPVVATRSQAGPSEPSAAPTPATTSV